MQAGLDGPGWCPDQLTSACCGCLQAPRSLHQTGRQRQQQAALHWVCQHGWLLETAAPHWLESAARLRVAVGPEGCPGQPAQGALRDRWTQSAVLAAPHWPGQAAAAPVLLPHLGAARTQTQQGQQARRAQLAPPHRLKSPVSG